MGKSSVMQFNQELSAYTVDDMEAKYTDQDFLIKNVLYEEYREAKKGGFKGTYNEYLSVRDYA